MAATGKPARITIEIDDRSLFRSIKIAAVEHDRTIKDIATEALRDWLHKLENAEDLAAIAEAEVDNGPDISWEQVKAELRDQEAAERAR